MYLGLLIGGGELKIDPPKMVSIMKWSMPTNISMVESLIGVTEYLRKFIASFSLAITPFHSIATSGKSFQWGKGQQRAFDEPRNKISQAPILTLPNLQQPFEVNTNVSRYVMRAVLIK